MQVGKLFLLVWKLLLKADGINGINRRLETSPSTRSEILIYVI
jgi:hypothetical protein